MSFKKTVARSAVVGAIGFALSGWVSVSARRLLTLGSRAGRKTARATNAVTVDRITVETVATVASGGTSGERIRVAGTSGHGIRAASTTPVGTISPSTGRVNASSRTSTTTAVPGDFGSWASGSRCDLSGGERSRVRANAALAIGGASGDMPLAPTVASAQRLYPLTVLGELVQTTAGNGSPGALTQGAHFRPRARSS